MYVSIENSYKQYSNGQVALFMHVTNGKLGNLQLPGAGLTTAELNKCKTRFVRRGIINRPNAT